jgi:hypothetical protein
MNMTPAARWREILLSAANTIAVLALMLLVYWVSPVQNPVDGHWLLRIVVGLVVVGVVLGWQLWRIGRSRRPMERAVHGVAVIVLVFLVVFANLYLAIQRAHPEAFTKPLDKVSAMYFTITTLVTVGFGDITATDHLAQVAVSCQMMLDLVLLAVVVRLLFSRATTALSQASDALSDAAEALDAADDPPPADRPTQISDQASVNRSAGPARFSGPSGQGQGRPADGES